MHTLKTFLNSETPIVVKWEGAEINASVRLNALSISDVAAIVESEQSEDIDILAIVPPLAKMYRSIDFAFDEGEPAIQVTEENLRRFPLPLLRAMQSAINQARTDKEAKKNSSAEESKNS